MPGYDLSQTPRARVLQLNKAERGALPLADPLPPQTALSQSEDKRMAAVGKRLEGHMGLRSFARKEHIYLPFEHTEKLYIVRRGFVEVGVLSREGRELAIEVLGKGDLFGPVVAGKLESEFARALGPSVIGDLSADQVEPLLHKHPDLVTSMMKLAADRHRRLSERFQNLVFMDVKERICRLLLDLHQKCGDSRGRIPITLTHQDIANLVASSRETASLHLSELKKSGVLDYNRRFLHILSTGALRRLLNAA